ncbi:PepSY domain-containing protein [Henriciella sp.]|uniref:PepSY domain-containing protein n=1 Tax=Henriciella sp. TaxID=1968823 RepID=UPI002638CCE7|nr:PepSY domain-containing protein [Henriciella sp.]
MKRTLTGLVLIAMLTPAPMAAAKDSKEGAGFYTISREQAVEIAREHGMVDIWETERDDGLWEIEGANADGVKLEIELSGRTGEVVKMETYGPDHESHGTHHSPEDDSDHRSDHHH